MAFTAELATAAGLGFFLTSTPFNDFFASRLTGAEAVALPLTATGGVVASATTGGGLAAFSRAATALRAMSFTWWRVRESLTAGNSSPPHRPSLSGAVLLPSASQRENLGIVPHLPPRREIGCLPLHSAHGCLTRTGTHDNLPSLLRSSHSSCLAA